MTKEKAQKVRSILNEIEEAKQSAKHLTENNQSLIAERIVYELNIPYQLASISFLELFFKSFNESIKLRIQELEAELENL
jgi:hypothetical protein